MKISRNDLVLEIGSGDNPNPRSDILCDRYIKTNHERAGEFRIRIDRTMIVADGMRLPFPDKTFDYVIASHIFEHMDDPAGFAQEIMRVGKAGFIEVPSALSERVFGWNFHHWYCRMYDGVLTFSPKKEGEQFNGYFHELIAREIWFRRFFEQHESKWYTWLEWQGKIPLKITRPMSRDEINGFDEKAWELLSMAKPEIVNDFLFSVRFFLRRVRRKAMKVVRGMLWRMRKLLNKKVIIESLRNICMCPVCQGCLLIKNETFVCEHCKADYPIHGVIPILLRTEEGTNA